MIGRPRKVTFKTGAQRRKEAAFDSFIVAVGGKVPPATKQQLKEITAESLETLERLIGTFTEGELCILRDLAGEAGHLNLEDKVHAVVVARQGLEKKVSA